MEINAVCSQDKSALIISVNGRFDFSLLKSFEYSYQNIDFEPEFYVIDLKNSENLDSSALGMLMALREKAEVKSAKVKIINCNESIKNMLLITKLNQMFVVE
jgi:anti-anti-sigma factor